MSTTSRLRILCVDDEPSLLDGLVLQLRRRYEVCTALSGAAGLEVLAESPDFAIIISDMRMPGMDGATFLAKARELLPDARRMLLTGQTDMDSAIAAVNRGQVFRFLTKPCPPPELLAAVESAAADYRAQIQGRSEFARDIEERVSGRDSLTGLASREGLLRWFASASNALNPDAPAHLTVLYLSVDGYSELDNATDPATFEQVERFVAERLRVCCPEAACLARWADNQFVVISVGGTPDGQGLQICASDLALAIGAAPPPEPLASIGVSLGAARWPADSSVSRTVIGFAEMAMQEARRLGGATACVFRPEWLQAADQRRGLLAALRHAIEHDELELHYQPILNVAGDSIHEIECLARWEHPVFGNVPPNVFVRLAEESGLIAQLGQRILQRACSEGKALIGERALRLAVNISVPQLLHADFIAQLDGILKATGFDPMALEMEITESVFANDLPRVAAVLNALRDRGIQIAIDDFGTGYSSLAYLNHLPVNCVKIDRSFVSSIGTGGAAIISAALDIARSRNIVVVIEGVETTQSLTQLRELGASLMQGFLFAKPMPAAALGEWLRRSYPESGSADLAAPRQA